MRTLLLFFVAVFPAAAGAAEFGDLPAPAQVEAALASNVDVQTAQSNVGLEQANKRKWDSGNYEFNLRAGSAQRRIIDSGQRLKEWDVSLERPLRLPNKMLIDGDIGAASVAGAEYALGDARHEASRALLHLWFNWQRELAQLGQWRQQVDILQQQIQVTEKRVQAGDAPHMELNLAQAAAAQALVSQQQARVRTQVAANELQRMFPALVLPVRNEAAEPQAITQDLPYWKDRMMEDNHALGMARENSRIQHLLAQRSRADRMPDPTVGVRYSSEMSGNERVAGVYVSIPLSFGVRGATAQGAAYQAEIASEREAAVRHQLDSDIASTYAQAVGNFQTWQQAHEAASNMQRNAGLVARAYSLGESSLSDVLNARRLALESSLSETVARLDANEARYRLLLDTHMLWPLEAHQVPAGQ